MSAQAVDLAKVRLDPELQPRSAIDSELVEEYAARLSGGAIFPPVVLFQDGEVLWLADGYHRHYAHKALGLAEIDAVVHGGDRLAALAYSLRANAEHGRQRGEADYRRGYQIAVRNGLTEAHDAEAVAAALSCSLRWAQELTKDVRERRRRERDAEIARQAAEGRSQQEIAKTIGVTQQAVSKRLKTNNETKGAPSCSSLWSSADIPVADSKPDRAAQDRFRLASELTAALAQFTIVERDPAACAAATEPVLRARQAAKARQITAWLDELVQALEIADAA